MKFSSFPALGLVASLVDLATADCWDNKCSRLGLVSTVSCASACSDKGYSNSGYELYTKGFLGIESWIGEHHHSNPASTGF